MTFEAWLYVGLWVAAGTSAALLGVGLQMPVRFRWRSQMRHLDPFTAKVFWGYASFVAISLVAFAIITVLLHDAMLAGERSAGVIAGFMAVWWTVRIGFDLASYGHAGWPQGARFVVAHALLLSGFVGLAVVYWTVVIRTI